VAKRKNIIKIETESVQGEGSFVKLRHITVSEGRDQRNAEKEEGFDAFEYNIKVLADHIVSWNWVDEDDMPLPLPKDDESVIGRLTDAEIEVLVNALGGEEEEEAKNE